MNAKNYKSFKVLVGVLSIGWLSVLAWNITPNELLSADILDAHGNIVASQLMLSEEDLTTIENLKAQWSEEEVHSNAYLRAEKAVQAYNNGDFENAIELYNEALALGKFDDENLLTILSNLALAYEADGYSENALKTYNVIFNKVSPQTALHHVMKGKMSLLAEFIDVEQAIASFESALAIEPNDFDAHNTLALIYMGEYGSEFTDYQKALSHNEKMNDLFFENVNVRINLATNYIALKNYSHAHKLLEEVIEMQPQSLPANYLMMKTLQLTGKQSEAGMYAQKLVNWNPEFKSDALIAEILNGA